jgi:hypothetical protein
MIERAHRGPKLLRVHIQLYEEDWRRLLAYYGGQVKRSSVVRELVHNWVKRIDAKAALSAQRVIAAGSNEEVSDVESPG